MTKATLSSSRRSFNPDGSTPEAAWLTPLLDAADTGGSVFLLTPTLPLPRRGLRLRRASGSERGGKCFRGLNCSPSPARGRGEGEGVCSCSLVETITAFTSGRDITSRLLSETTWAFTFSPSARARAMSRSETARKRTAGWTAARLARRVPIRPDPTTATPRSFRSFNCFSPVPSTFRPSSFFAFQSYWDRSDTLYPIYPSPPSDGPNKIFWSAPAQWRFFKACGLVRNRGGARCHVYGKRRRVAALQSIYFVFIPHSEIRPALRRVQGSPEPIVVQGAFRP
jgi:hypothetical protein